MKTHTFFDTTCPTCGRRAGDPFRVFDARGKVLQGCVDEFHTDELVTPSESARWHARPVAKKMRRDAKAARMGGITRDVRHQVQS